jgi:hypothetical protein
VLCGVACPGLHSSPRSNQGSAVGALRTIHTAEETYRETYKKGFSEALGALGPPKSGEGATASAADLVYGELASGKTRGYTFEYRPGARDASGIVKAFTVSARSPAPGRCGANLFTDETGVIHQTNENRPATAKDPVIGP